MRRFGAAAASPYAHPYGMGGMTLYSHSTSVPRREGGMRGPRFLAVGNRKYDLAALGVRNGTLPKLGASLEQRTVRTGVV